MRFDVPKNKQLQEISMPRQRPTIFLFRFAGLLLATALALGSLAACGGSGSAAHQPASSGTSPTAAGGNTAGPGNSTAAPAATGVAPSAAPSNATLNEQISALERRGAFPALDRSPELIGPDADGNGIRDDIDAWIRALSVNDQQRKALLQKARTLQATLAVDLGDEAALQRVGEGLMASTNCLGDTFSDFSRISRKIEAMTANTRARAERYMAYNAARSGSSTMLPRENTCEP
jgi:hypothetical protein